MKCEASTYPVGFILSDLQAYADAGTVTSALNNLVKNAATLRRQRRWLWHGYPNDDQYNTGSATTNTTSAPQHNNSPEHINSNRNGGTLTLQYKAPSRRHVSLSSQTANRGQPHGKPGAKKADSQSPGSAFASDARRGPINSHFRSNPFASPQRLHLVRVASVGGHRRTLFQHPTLSSVE